MLARVIHLRQEPYEPTQKTVTGTDGAYCLDSGGLGAERFVSCDQKRALVAERQRNGMRTPVGRQLAARRHPCTVAVEWRTQEIGQLRQVRLDQRDPFLQSFL